MGMTRRIGILVIVAMGVLWGLSEVFVGDVFYRFQIPMRAAVLTGLGIALLVVGRLIDLAIPYRARFPGP